MKLFPLIILTLLSFTDLANTETLSRDFDRSKQEQESAFRLRRCLYDNGIPVSYYGPPGGYYRIQVWSFVFDFLSETKQQAARWCFEMNSR